MNKVLVVLVFCIICQPIAAKQSLSRESRKILHAKCIDCHASNVKMPWYAELPLVKGLVQEDVEQGIAGFNIPAEIDAKNDKDLDEGTKLHLEMVLMDRTMPPKQYGLVHWDKWLNQQELQTLLAWLKSLEN